VAALFMLNVPAAIGALGLGTEMQTARLKLSSSLPNYLRETEAGVRQRIKIDLNWWHENREGFPDLLRKLYRAVWEDKVVKLVVQYAFGYLSEHLVEAYSLVAQGQRWFLVCQVEENLKVFWLSDIHSVTVKDEIFEREEGYDLDQFWRTYEQEMAAIRNQYLVNLRIKKDVFEYFTQVTTGDIIELENYPGEVWRRITIKFDYLEKARRELLPFGGAVEVIEPFALRLSMADYARQILANHEHPEIN
jgi:predicted DNA-binding transcriptional regulator YafY